MRYALFILMGVVLSLASCKKREIRKGWESLYGQYEMASPDLLYQDSMVDSVMINSLSISESGVIMSLVPGDENSYGAVFHSYLSDDPSYDYRLSLSSLTKFYFDGTGLVQAYTPSESKLNDGRLYYLKKLSENNLSFVIVNTDNGTIISYQFIK